MSTQTNTFTNDNSGESSSGGQLRSCFGYKTATDSNQSIPLVHGGRNHPSASYKVPPPTDWGTSQYTLPNSYDPGESHHHVKSPDLQPYRKPSQQIIKPSHPEISTAASDSNQSTGPNAQSQGSQSSAFPVANRTTGLNNRHHDGSGSYGSRPQMEYRTETDESQAPLSTEASEDGKRGLSECMKSTAAVVAGATCVICSETAFELAKQVCCTALLLPCYACQAVGSMGG